MLPESLPHYSIGPFFGFAVHVALAILCLVILIPYRDYRPLRGLFSFYLFSALLFLGWTIYGLQKSPESILLGYRLDLAALALLPASWIWFVTALFNEKPGKLFWIVTFLSFCLFALALFGKGAIFLGLPLEPHHLDPNILRPRSIILKPLIYSFCLSASLLYILMVIQRLRLLKKERTSYLLPVAIGMSSWFLGGLHDALRSIGMGIFFKGQALWLSSFGLSIFLTMAIALHFRFLQQAIRETRDVFERFVPPAYLRRIAKEGLGSIRLGEADRQWVTILCCDIRGFTSLSERLDPSQLIAHVNRLFEQFTGIVERSQGVIDKFLGDAVLCIFEGVDSAQRAVACGVEMLRVVRILNVENHSPADQAIRIGIGLHSGPVILGTIGSSERMDSTVLGLTVNLAKRLEELTKSLGVQMLISDEVVHRLPDGHPHPLRSLGEVSVKGSSVPLTVFEVVSAECSE